MDDVLIVGTGAMALLFGSRLVSAGVDVCMLGTWEEGIKALRKHGIRVRSETGDQSYPVEVISDVKEVDQVSFALVLVKSWQTSRAAHFLDALLKEDGLTLTLQNGLGNLEQLINVLGENRAVQGITTYGATLLEPGLVRSGGEGKVKVGYHSRLEPLVLILKRAGLNVEETADLTNLVWSKLIINAAINPLSALLGVPNGELLNSTAARKLMSLIAGETSQVAIEKGVDLIFQDPTKAVEEVASATASNISSMLQDINRGAPTEIDAICGAIIQEGNRLGIPTPINSIMFHLIKSQVELSKKNIDENR